MCPGGPNNFIRWPLSGMSIYIDSSSHLHHDLEKNLVVTCPHCQAVAHITPSAVPRFEDLQLYRPKQIGMVYRCDACHAPIFMRFTARVYGAARIELSPQFTEVERAREKFSFAYIPEEVELLFREALACFSQGAELDVRVPLPLLDGYEAGIMLEVVKDLLYEAYVRKGKLQQAIMVRRFFLEETGSHVTPLVSAS